MFYVRSAGIETSEIYFSETIVEEKFERAGSRVLNEDEPAKAKSEFRTGDRSILTSQLLGFRQGSKSF